MNTNTLLMEAIFIAIIAVMTLIAYKKGVVQIISGLIGTIGGAILSFKLTPIVSPLLTKVFTVFFSSRVEKAALKFGFDDILNKTVSSETFKGFSDFLAKLGITDTVTAESVINAGGSVKKLAASALAERIAPIVTFLLIFLAVKLIIWAIVELLKLDIPVLSTFNRLAGAVFGALAAVITIFIICLAIYHFAPESGAFLSVETLRAGLIGRLLTPVNR